MYTSAHAYERYDHNNIHRSSRYRHQEAPRKLAKNTGGSRSFLAAEGQEYLDVNEWQVAGINGIESADREGTISHEDVQAWIATFGTGNELPIPKPTNS